MRAVILALALAAPLALGCSIADELDAAHKEMERYDNSEAKKAKEKKEAAAAQKKKKKAKPDLLSGWRDKTSLGNEYEDDAIVTCQLDGRSQFMSRNDCLSQGGQAR